MKFWTEVILILGIVVTCLLLGFVLGVLIADKPNCPVLFYENKVIEEKNVTDLNWCLEQVKNVDEFQQELNKKSWLK